MIPTTETIKEEVMSLVIAKEAFTLQLVDEMITALRANSIYYKSNLHISIYTTGTVNVRGQDVYLSDYDLTYVSISVD